MGLMEQFANPETMHSLSMGEKLAGAGITTIMGMGITFIVLILLWGCVAVMTKFTYRPKKETPAAPPPPAAATPPASAASTPASATDDSLIAIISAAIAAYEGTTANSLVVRKISRISGATTAWGDAGRADCIDSRKF